MLPDNLIVMLDTARWPPAPPDSRFAPGRVPVSAGPRRPHAPSPRLAGRRAMPERVHVPEDARFPTTCWSVVLAARDREEPQAREALAILCTAYWYPLYAFIRRRGSPADL